MTFYAVTSGYCQISSGAIKNPVHLHYEPKPRICQCRDLKEISGEFVGWKDPMNLNSHTNSHLPEQISLSSHGKHMMAPNHKAEKCIHIILLVQMVIIPNRLPCLYMGNTRWICTKKLRNDV